MSEIFDLNQLPKYISVVWIPVVFYLAGVELIVLVRDPKLFLNPDLILNRVIFLGIFGLTLLFFKIFSRSAANLFSIILIYAGLTVLYKETALLNQLFYPIMDPILEHWDKAIFGFQPALAFSQKFPEFIFSELLFFGYFSYYLMPLIILLVVFKQFPNRLTEFGFLLIGSFLVYYFLFILFPAVGPQFYWSHPDGFIEPKGFFGHIIKIIQENGEAPTAAFPSSHVGIALILMIWLFKNKRLLFYVFIPNVLLLIPATVYIKAHYFVDILAGILTAPLIYLLVSKSYIYLREKYLV